MPAYINPNSYIVSLIGPEGVAIKLKPNEVVHLPDFYDRYRSRGFIKYADPNVKPKELSYRKQDFQTQSRPIMVSPPHRTRQATSKPVVGGVAKATADEILKKNQSQVYPISNNIGLGILCYNRVSSLKRCIESLKRTTDLNKTTVFISDDASDLPEMISYLNELENDSNFVVLRNDTRLGVAGNSNRLLRALKRFKYGFLANDDIEFLQVGWEQLYVKAMVSTGLMHLVFRQPGIYDAKAGESQVINNIRLTKVVKNPHGALLAFKSEYVDIVGAFDVSYGIYGMEHVDWSSKAYELGEQPIGFYDVYGSTDYIRLHNDITATKEKHDSLRAARELFKDRKKEKCPFDSNSVIPCVTYIVPFREQERTRSLLTVINNIRAQRYPDIEIILCEQDIQTRIPVSEYEPIKYERINLANQHPFNKSMAFNKAASMASSQNLILHDADMMAVGSYTKDMVKYLETRAVIHLGATVLYADQATTNRINDTNDLNDMQFERVVGYFEGGSLGIKKSAFFDIGGFCERFFGYGNEDTEFYGRVASLKSFLSHRIHNFLHLKHGRSDGWIEQHENNKKLEEHLKGISLDARITECRAALKNKGYF